MKTKYLRAQRKLWADGVPGDEDRSPPVAPWLLAPRARWRWAVRRLGYRPVSVSGFLHAYYATSLALSDLCTRPSPFLERLRREAQE